MIHLSQSGTASDCALEPTFPAIPREIVRKLILIVHQRKRRSNFGPLRTGHHQDLLARVRLLCAISVLRRPLPQASKQTVGAATCLINTRRHWECRMRLAVPRTPNSINFLFIDYRFRCALISPVDRLEIESRRTVGYSEGGGCRESCTGY